MASFLTLINKRPRTHPLRAYPKADSGRVLAVFLPRSPWSKCLPSAILAKNVCIFPFKWAPLSQSAWSQWLLQCQKAPTIIRSCGRALGERAFWLLLSWVAFMHEVSGQQRAIEPPSNRRKPAQPLSCRPLFLRFQQEMQSLKTPQKEKTQFVSTPVLTALVKMSVFSAFFHFGGFWNFRFLKRYLWLVAKKPK